ncbi:hypothetical protein EJ03DRAFT_328534 [Teratosphaeria nubilosa]|uniref:Long chronological lifespan protein 2 n=1 Tax=Teratosphaeria nubilosa TaxID=161662 RepID=A0A6G1L5F2_9PEZI|nr:hypothetical protein EJ03DRAFT_328534 [Teratosphaeria nubilosa]
MKPTLLLPLLASLTLGYQDKGWRCFPPVFQTPAAFGVCFPPLELQKQGVAPKSCGYDLLCPYENAFCDPDWEKGSEADCAGEQWL